MRAKLTCEFILGPLRRIFMPTALYFCTRLGDGVPVSSEKYREFCPPPLVLICLLIKRDFQANSSQAQIADSSSRNAVNFSSACTMKRFPSSQCASAIQIVRAARIHGCDTAPTPTGFAEVVSDDFPVLHAQRIPARLLY